MNKYIFYREVRGQGGHLSCHTIIKWWSRLKLGIPLFIIVSSKNLHYDFKNQDRTKFSRNVLIDTIVKSCSCIWATLSSWCEWLEVVCTNISSTQLQPHQQISIWFLLENVLLHASSLCKKPNSYWLYADLRLRPVCCRAGAHETM